MPPTQPASQLLLSRPLTHSGWTGQKRDMQMKKCRFVARESDQPATRPWPGRGPYTAAAAAGVCLVSFNTFNTQAMGWKQAGGHFCSLLSVHRPGSQPTSRIKALTSPPLPLAPVTIRHPGVGWGRGWMLNVVLVWFLCLGFFVRRDDSSPSGGGQEKKRSATGPVLVFFSLAHACHHGNMDGLSRVFRRHATRARNGGLEQGIPVRLRITLLGTQIHFSCCTCKWDGSGQRTAAGEP